MTEEFQHSIREWVSLDNKVKTMNDELKTLRAQRQELTSRIMTISETEGYGDPVINISDGKLKFASVRTIGSLTLGYVKSCLEACIDDNERVNEIMEYIKENRPVKEVRDIRRYVDK